MYTCYISKYKEGDSIIDTPICIYDKRSPALDMRVSNPILELQDSAAGSFRFTLPKPHFMYDKIVEKLTEITVKDDDEIIFEGSIYSNEKDWYMNKQVIAEGYPAYLNDTTQPRREFFNVSMKDYLKALLEVHNEKSVHKIRIIEDAENPEDNSIVDVLFPEEVSRSKREQIADQGQIVYTKSEVSTYEYTQYESTMYYLTSLKSRCGGHFIFTRLGKDDYRLDYITELKEQEDAQTIAIGENLLDYNESNDYQLLCTSVLPVAKASSGVTSEIGEVLGIVPDVTVGKSNDLNDLTDSDVSIGDHVYLQTNDVCKLYKVTSFTDNKPSIKFITDKFFLHLGCRLGKVNGDVIPVYFNDYDKDTRAFKSYSCFPEEATARDDLYYIDLSAGANGVYWHDSGHYYQITGSEATTIFNNRAYHVLQLSDIDEITPEIHKFYISARNNNYGEIHGYDTRYLAAIAKQGVYNLVEYPINDTDWTSILDREVDISYSSEGADNYGATVLYVAGWGNSLPTRICREAYYYRTKDYSVGEVINLTDRATLMERSIIFWDGHYYDEQWRDWHIDVHTESYYDSAFTVLKIDVEGIHDKIYISTRQQHFKDPEVTGDWARNDGPIWYATDSSNQTLGYENKENSSDYGPHLPSVIYKVIDLGSANLYGAKWLYIGCWGDAIPVTANKYVEKSGSLQDYITVETAAEYRIKISMEQPGDECLHEEGSLYVESPSLIEKFGRIEKKIEFNNVNSPEMLCEKAVDYLINSQFGEVTRDIQGVDLHNQNVDIQAFRISTKVPVFSPAHNCNKTFDLLGLTITLDNPADSSIRVSEQITMEDRLREAGE